MPQAEGTDTPVEAAATPVNAAEQPMGSPVPDATGTPAPVAGKRQPRRASLPAPAGSDPKPSDPPQELRPEAENDDRLTADKPPHWG